MKRVVDSEAVWGLMAKGTWVIAADEAGTELFPVWSDAIYAEACREAAWAGTQAAPIPLEQWKEKWLPGLERDGRRVAVFPISGGSSGLGVDPRRLLDDLQAEEERY